jgi:cytoskeletal protein RodZ
MRDGFTRKRVESLTLGEKLRKLRSQYRMSLAEISKATRIQVKYLEALENGAYGELPAEVYVRGFLKNYARYLGLEDEVFLKLYDKEKNIQANLGRERELVPAALPALRVSTWIITPRTLVIAGIILVLGGTFLYLFLEFRAFVAEPRLIITEPVAGATIDGASLTLRGRTDRGARVLINNEPVFVDTNGDFGEELSLQPGLNAVVVSATNRFQKTKTETVAVESRIEPVSTEAVDEGRSVADSFSVTVAAGEQAVRVMAKTGETVLYSGALEPGQEYVLERLTGEVSVSTDNARGTLIAVDGATAQPMGERPIPVTDKIYTKNGAR